MKKSISLVLVMMMFMTMLTPMHAFGSEYSRINLFYILDPAVFSEPSIKVYDWSMEVSAYPTSPFQQTKGSLGDFKSYSHMSIDAAETVYFNVFVESRINNNSYAGTFQVDPTTGGDRIITIGFDPDLGANAITFKESPVKMDATLTHQAPNFNIAYMLNGSHILQTNKAVEPGNYEIYYTHKEGGILKALRENVVLSEGETEHVGEVTEGTQNYPLTLIQNNLTIAQDNLHVGQRLLTSLTGISSVETNIDNLQRFVKLDGNGTSYHLAIPFLPLYLPMDLTHINATSNGVQEFANGVHINQLFMFIDNNGYPVMFNQINGGTITVESSNSIYSGPMNSTYIDLGNHSGITNITIDIPELGLLAERTIIVSGGVVVPPPPTFPVYNNYDVKVINPQTNLPLVGTYVATEMSRNRIHIYVPESSEAILTIKGIYEDETTTAPLPLTFNSAQHPQYQYDPADGFITLGIAQGGYGDSWYGNAENAQIIVHVYKGTLGKMRIENVESTPAVPSYYSGTVEYNISYKLTNGDQSGSNSNGWVHNGDFLVPLQNDMLGVSYAYTIISPAQGNSSVPQANTPFVEITDKLGNVVNGFVDLGSAKFQTPTFTATVLDKNLQPAERILTFANGYYQGIEMDLYHVQMVLSTWQDDASQKFNRIYFAPFGPDFSNTYDFKVESHNTGMKPITQSVDITTGEAIFVEQSDQISVTMNNPSGNLLEEGSGLDRHIYVEEVGKLGSINAYMGNKSTASLAGFKEGVEYTIQLKPDLGDFDHLYYYDGRKVTFKYTSIPGDYTALDSIGNEIPFTVDGQGMMHLTLSLQMAQIYGNVYAANAAYAGFTTVHAFDAATGKHIGSGTVHTAGGFNNEPIQYGLFLIGNDKPITGNVRLVVDDPKDTVMFSGTTLNVTLPINAPIRIDLPESKVFGSVTLSADDTLEFADNITRVFVNLFDATGQFVKNVLVRRDGMFSAGELADGKYFAKVFVSPFSPLANKYTSSKMNIFTVDNNSVGSVPFNAPLIRVIGETHVTDPSFNPQGEVWVRIYNGNGAEVEALKSNEWGMVKIPQLPDGEYSIKAFGKNGLEDSTSVRFTIEWGALKSGIETLVLTSPQLTGEVKDTNGNSISDVTVMLYDAKMNLVSSEVSSNGNFSFGGLINGNYLLQVRTDDNRYVASELIQIDYAGDLIHETITLEEAYYVGAVRLPSGELANKGWVHVYENGAYYKSLMVSDMGRFVIEAVNLQSTYEIFAEDSTGRYMPSAKLLLSQTPELELTLRQNIGLKTTLFNGADIMSNTKYYLYDAEGNALYQGRTNVFGDMTLVDLPYGTYTVIVPMGTDFMSAKIVHQNEGVTLPATVLINGR